MKRVKNVEAHKYGVKRKFLTYKEAATMYGIGLTRMQEFAKDAGATYKLGQKVLVNTEIFEDYLEGFRIPGEAERALRR